MAEQNKKRIGRIDRIPVVEFDHKRLVDHLVAKRQNLDEDRQDWLFRQSAYLEQWDDYVTNVRAGSWDEYSNLHLPLTMMQCKALHARLYFAVFGLRPPYVIEPVEDLDEQRIRRIDRLMKWAIFKYVNEYKGIRSTVDDWLWDAVTNGWGVLEREWMIKERNAIVLKEDTKKQIRETLISISGEPLPSKQKKRFKEVAEFIEFFNGPVINTIPPEAIYFPARFQDSTDLNQPDTVIIQKWFTRSELEILSEKGFFEKKAVKKMIDEKHAKALKEQSSMGKTQIERKQDILQGFQTVDAKAQDEKFEVFKAYARYDFDEDNKDEELITYFSEDAKVDLRWTYLDRITKTGKRPLHKFDLIRRPRRAGALGLAELLYPINTEVDAFHNQRVDFGTFANVPFFVYRAASGLKAETIVLRPGRGIPVDDVNNDIRFPQRPNATNWGMSEESNLFLMAERLTSINDLSLGRTIEPVGPTRAASGVAQILGEAGINIGVIIERMNEAYSDCLQGILSDLQERMPDDIRFRVTGFDGISELDEMGLPFSEEIHSRMEIGGRVDFIMMANSQNTNRELEKQNSLILQQLLFNPIALQMGIVGPNNIYETYKMILEKHQFPNIQRFITQPQNVQRPMTLIEELSSIIQGLKPNIVLNDQHEEKAQAIISFMTNEETLKGLELGSVSPMAPKIAGRAIRTHRRFAEVIAAQAQPANFTGLQISPTLGARVSGQVGETGRSLPEENMSRQLPQTQETNGQAGGMEFGETK